MNIVGAAAVGGAKWLIKVALICTEEEGAVIVGGRKGRHAALMWCLAAQKNEKYDAWQAGLASRSCRPKTGRKRALKIHPSSPL